MSTIPPLATGKWSETIQNSVYVLIHKECIATLEKRWRQLEENNEILATLEIPWETRERACSAQQQKACDRMLPPGGQALGLARPQTKGLRGPSQMANSFIPQNEGDWMCLGALGLTHWIQALRVRQQPAVCEGDKEGCTCKSCCHILQNTKNRVQENPKALLPARQNQGERVLVLQKVLMLWADWWLKPSRRNKMLIERLIYYFAADITKKPVMVS